MFFKKNDHQATPQWFMDEIYKEFGINMDPCPLHGEETKDGLKEDWGTSNYVNPPFSNVRPWIEKSIVEMKKGNKTVLLIPARLNAKYWFDKIIPNASEVRFLGEKLNFGSHTKPLLIPLALVIFEPGRGRNDEMVKDTGKYLYASWKLT